MIKTYNVITPSPEQWKSVIMGARNAFNSWDKSDSIIEGCSNPEFIMGSEDFKLLCKLSKAGGSHSKYRRMLNVLVDITAPLYWWKEFDTYKVGTVFNSCSTMHTIHTKRFEMSDFSTDHLKPASFKALGFVVKTMNEFRDLYLEAASKGSEGIVDAKVYWWQMIQLLPSSYNQKRTVSLNYEVLAHIYQDRQNHRLDEWRELCTWIKSLPFSEVITNVEFI